MKILLINDYDLPIGGAETFVYNLESALKSRGHVVKILGSKKRENFSSFFSRWYSFKWYNKTKKEIKDFNPDLIHINGFGRVLSPSPINASLDSNTPVVATMHDFHYYCPKTWGIYENGAPCPYGFGYKCFISNCGGGKRGFKNIIYNWIKILKVGLHRKIIKNIDKQITFTAPSNKLTENLKKSLSIDVKTVRYGIVPQKEITNYNKQILFAGRLVPEKGLECVLPILNKVKNYPVCILGEGPLKKVLENKYKNVNFLGFQNPKKYLLKSNILLVPSIWMENFPYSVLEAMSYGLCVIGSNIGGIPEQIQHMKTGLLFKPGDEKDFAEKLDYLLKNPSEIKRMGKNAREFVKKNFDWNKIIKQYEQVYKETIKEFKDNHPNP